MCLQPVRETFQGTSHQTHRKLAAAVLDITGIMPVLPANSREKCFSLQIDSPCRKGRLENIFIESHPNTQVSLSHLLEVRV